MLTGRLCALFCTWAGAGFVLSALQQHLVLISTMTAMPAGGLRAGAGKEDCIQKLKEKMLHPLVYGSEQFFVNLSLFPLWIT